MNRQMTIGKKLLHTFTGFAVVMLILGGIGYFSAYKGENAIDEIGEVRLPSVDSLLVIKENAMDIRGSFRTLALPGLSNDVRQRQYANLNDSREEYEKAWKIYEPLPQTPEEADLWKKFVPAWQSWREENNKALSVSKKVDENGIADPMDFARHIEQFTKDHYILMDRVRNLLENRISQFDGGDDSNNCNAGKFFKTFTTGNPALSNSVKNMAESHRQFHESIGKIKQLKASGNAVDANSMFEHETRKSSEEVSKHFEAMLSVANESLSGFKQLADQLLGPVTQKQRIANELLDRIIEINREIAHKVSKASSSDAEWIKLITTVSALIALVFALSFGIIITRSINNSLRRIIDGLADGADQVASAAGQVSSASQSLAEGASEQASGIEETSSSLEEMSSMTKQNADNANQANALMTESRQVVNKANTSMGQLTISMADISKASEETSKIIKTIDEIAFQTNLLALNAAVEA
ncbi:MAG: MCP four helix bundle domain-containing protein, partial [Desulfatirhabdiaceae bacterium]